MDNPSPLASAVRQSALEDEPYYVPLADEVDIFLAAYEARLPILLKGPTGCGKTRFVESMAYRLYRTERASDPRRAI